MKKKEEVYVVVDSEKKADKLQNVLDMFGEYMYKAITIKYIKYDIECYHFKIYPKHGAGCITNGFSIVNKTKVSIKELRNILAAEYLKEGDVVVCTINGEELGIGYFKGYDDTFGFTLEQVKYPDDLNYVSISKNNGGCFNNFLRYATEEEKALLNPQLIVAEIEQKIKQLKELM